MIDFGPNKCLPIGFKLQFSTFAKKISERNTKLIHFPREI